MNEQNNIKLVLKISLLFVVLLLSQLTLFAQSKETRTAQQVLAKLFIADYLDDSTDKAYIYFLKKNFPLAESIDDVNKNRKTKIKLIDEPVLGEEVYFFESFFVRSNL